MAAQRVSVIVPVLNEASNIERLISSLLSQTRPPDEIVLADGGSTDGTLEILARLGREDDRIRVVSGPGGISENRNAAIEAAHNEIIACTDAGCVPDLDWLESIVAPFEHGARWVAGMSRPSDRSLLEQVTGYALMPVPEEIDPDRFIPGGASQAFLRNVWERAGRFPEGMVAGEDTVFGGQLQLIGMRPVFAPSAMVSWQAPTSIGSLIKKAYRWGSADGAAGTSPMGYAEVLAAYWAPLGLALVSAAAGLWGWSVGLGGLLMVLAVWRTRRRSHHVGLAGKLLLPVAHLVKMWAQSLGWLVSFARMLGAGGLGKLLGRLVAKPFLHLVAAFKRLIRPYVPDALIAKMRTPTDGRGRINVDIVDDDPTWLLATPDTYRLITPPATDRAETVRLLAQHYDVVAIAETRPPEINRSKIGEPRFRALEVTASEQTFARIGSRRPDVVLATAIQAGLSVAVIPVTPGGAVPGRSDRIAHHGVAAILAAVPMHDVGGGSRGAQMAHELVAAGYHVVYVNYFDADESVDLGLRYLSSRLEQVRFSDFDAAALIARVDVADRLVIVELPHADYLPPLVELEQAGFKIVYDLIDDWVDPELGAWGYRRHVDAAIQRMATAVTASAPSLVESVATVSGRKAVLVPNAVNTRLFKPGAHPRPADLGAGVVFEYHGSLYGEWFDWAGLAAVGEAFEEVTVAVIGDPPKRRPPTPANVVFLGLKPQHHLPAYVAHTSVGIIPWHVTEMTHAVSPLKVFEYMAMGVPVAAPPLKPLLGLDGVFCDVDLVKAIRSALAGPPPDPALAAAEHGWGARMKVVFSSVGFEYATDPSARPIEILQRPTRHYTNRTPVLA